MKQKCTCPCHQEGAQILHIKPCCYNGYEAGIDPFEKEIDPFKKQGDSQSFGAGIEPTTSICIFGSPHNRGDGLYEQLTRFTPYNEVGFKDSVDAGVAILGPLKIPYSEPCRNSDEVLAALTNLQIINKYSLHSLI